MTKIKSRINTLSVTVLSFCFATVSPVLMAASLSPMSLALFADLDLVDTGSSHNISSQEVNSYHSDSVSNPFIGSWKLMSGRYLDENDLWVNYESLNLRAIKVISAAYFSFTTVKESGEQGDDIKDFWAAGTGRYEFTDSHYIEYPTLNSFGAGKGASFSFAYELKGNELHTKRIEAGKLKEAEVWQKLD
ncbi:hypothetical protein [Shewanella hanedai]|nr:hypothetical protein [Shewanella hanedai]